MLAVLIIGLQAEESLHSDSGTSVRDVGDMWRMIWEKDSTCIVMLCQILEDGQVCHHSDT